MLVPVAFAKTSTCPFTSTVGDVSRPCIAKSNFCVPNPSTWLEIWPLMCKPPEPSFTVATLYHLFPDILPSSEIWKTHSLSEPSLVKNLALDSVSVKYLPSCVCESFATAAVKVTSADPFIDTLPDKSPPKVIVLSFVHISALGW